MKVLSIDVGIKNLAYCLIEANKDKTFSIIQWDVLNLCGNQMNCQHITKMKSSTKNKKIANANAKDKECNKKATHVLNDHHICSTHLKKLHPNNLSMKTVKKAKLNTLLEIANKHAIKFDTPLNKKNITEILLKYIEENLYHEIPSVSANHMDLITIGITIKNLFNECFTIGEIDKIIIENQLTNRMKSIQGMLAQYFIMNNKTDIQFISATNKLKYFVEEGKKTEYKERKKMGVEITNTILTNKNAQEHLSFFIKHKKKDDLADSFLQGMWYLIHHSYVVYQK
jgi:hypothetical protein